MEPMNMTTISTPIKAQSVTGAFAGTATTNTVESFFALLKRSNYGIYT